MFKGSKFIENLVHCNILSNSEKAKENQISTNGNWLNLLQVFHIMKYLADLKNNVD